MRRLIMAALFALSVAVPTVGITTAHLSPQHAAEVRFACNGCQG